MSRSPLQLCLCPQPFGHATRELKPPQYFCLLGSQFSAGTLPLLTLSAQSCSQGWRGEERTCDCVLGTQAVPAMWQKEQGEAAKLIVGQVLDCQSALAMCQCSHLLSTVRSVAVCQHTLLALGPAFGQPCLLASHPASPPG